MFVSVIIPTYNRSTTILYILEALESQTFQNFEVIICNDGSTDNTRTVLQKAQLTSTYPIHVLNNPNAGRAAARNRGAQAAKGEVFVFFDDDVRPNPKCLALHVEFHTSHTSCCMDGPYLFDLELSKQQGDFQYYRAQLEMSWNVENKGFTKKKRAGINGGNHSMPRTLFMTLGGYNEQLTDSEDFEFAFRAMHHYQYDIYNNYQAWVYHDDFKNFQQYFKRRLEANNSSKRLVHLYPEILVHYSSKFIFHPKLWKRPFFNVFKAPFFQNLPTTKFFLNCFPQKLRYKLYDIIITANTLYN
jgi:glycosyltransferase involved in cell wall biosynthesis